MSGWILFSFIRNQKYLALRMSPWVVQLDSNTFQVLTEGVMSSSISVDPVAEGVENEVNSPSIFSA
jgi:hypothetical protein